MDPTDLQARYALALQLVPDPDAAGDLFMAAATEQGLLNRINRWRARHGLPPVALPSERCPLSPEEAEHALHLARRAVWRRRLQGIGALAALLLAGLVAPFFTAAPPLHGLAASPVFAQAPLQQVSHPGGYRVAVYKVEANPGEVTVWWSATGPDAQRAAVRLAPRLMLDSLTAEWLEPGETELATPRENRLLGRSTFQTFITVEREALLTFAPPGSGRVGVLLSLPLVFKEDETARTIPLDQAISEGPVTLRLHSLTLGRRYTQVRYASSAAIARSPALYTIQVGNVRLNRKGPLVQTPAGLLEATFEALPEMVDRLSLTFTSVFVTLPPRTYQLPAEAEVFTRAGSTVTVVQSLEDAAWGTAAQGYLTGAGGERYPTTLAFQVEGQPAHHRIMLRAEEVDPDAELVSYTLVGLRQEYHFADIPVTLSR